MAITSGLVVGKIRAFVASQAVFTPTGSTTTWLKSISHATDILGKIGLHQVTAYTDKDAGWLDTVVNYAAKGVAYATTAHEEHCESAVCHRITSFFGLLYEHDKLNVATHNTLHEMFGVGHGVAVWLDRRRAVENGIGLDGQLVPAQVRGLQVVGGDMPCVRLHSL